MDIREIKNKKYFYQIKDRRKYHIVDILIHEPEPQIIYKYFGIHKRWWHYKIDDLYIFNERIKSDFFYFKDK